MVAKRGVYIDAVYFHAPPYTSERAKQKVVDLAKKVAAYSGPIRLHVINFTDIQMYLYDPVSYTHLVKPGDSYAEGGNPESDAAERRYGTSVIKKFFQYTAAGGCDFYYGENP